MERVVKEIKEMSDKEYAEHMAGLTLNGMTDLDDYR